MTDWTIDIECSFEACPGSTLALTFGRNVRFFRQKQNLPKYLLAHMAGISRPHLDAIECGMADVRLSTVERLGHALAVHPVVLLHDFGH